MGAAAPERDAASPPWGTTLCLTVNTENCVPLSQQELKNLNYKGDTRMKVDFVL